MQSISCLIVKISRDLDLAFCRFSCHGCLRCHRNLLLQQWWMILLWPFSGNIRNVFWIIYDDNVECYLCKLMLASCKIFRRDNSLIMIQEWFIVFPVPRLMFDVCTELYVWSKYPHFLMKWKWPKPVFNSFTISRSKRVFCQRTRGSWVVQLFIAGNSHLQQKTNTTLERSRKCNHTKM